MKILNVIFLIYLGICFLASLYITYLAYQGTQKLKAVQQTSIVTATFQLGISELILSLMLCGSFIIGIILVIQLMVRIKKLQNKAKKDDKDSDDKDSDDKDSDDKDSDDKDSDDKDS